MQETPSTEDEEAKKKEGTAMQGLSIVLILPPWAVCVTIYSSGEWALEPPLWVVKSHNKRPSKGPIVDSS